MQSLLLTLMKAMARLPLTLVWKETSCGSFLGALSCEVVYPLQDWALH